MTAQEILEIVEAFLRGEVIEIKGPDGTWIQIFFPSWNFKDFDYRVAPKTIPPTRFLAWKAGSGELQWLAEDSGPLVGAKRVPELDLTGTPRP